MIYDLPRSVEVCGAEYDIRSDYRCVLDVCTALSDPDLDEQDRALVVLDIFYPNFSEMPPEHYEEAVRRCFWFINCGGAQQNKKSPKLMDWDQDFNLVVSPINRVVGKEIRSAEYLHWWSFISAYYEIGDCLFAQVVRIREKKSKGVKLDKSENDWYKQNRDLVDIKTTYTEKENDILKQWLGG